MTDFIASRKEPGLGYGEGMQGSEFAALDFMLDWTLCAGLRLDGIGIHSGMPARLEILPSPVPGLWLLRAGQRLRLDVSQVQDTRYCTSAGPAGDPVMTLEHVLAALWGLGISAAELAIEGPEAPIFDGSAAPLCRALLAIGLRPLASRRAMFTLETPWRWQQGDVRIEVTPAAGLEIVYRIEFQRPTARIAQQRRFVWSPRAFVEELAPARTFSFAADVEGMRAQGLIRGGSLANALVLDETGTALGEIRFPDEPVRHKLLDCLGDLALLGAWLQARISIDRGGHSAHVTMVKSLKERALPVDERTSSAG